MPGRPPLRVRRRRAPRRPMRRGTGAVSALEAAMTDTRLAPGRRYRTAHADGFALQPTDLLMLIACGAVAVALLAVAGAPAPLRLDPPFIAHVTGLLAGYGVAVM